jgi:hypothetical protein
LATKRRNILLRDLRRGLEQRPHRVQAVGVRLDAHGKRVFRLVGLQLQLVGRVLAARSSGGTG